jgi:hypothetical protein
MTAEQRQEAARKASDARWAKNDKRIEAALKEVTEGTAKLLKKTKRRKSVQK